MGLDILSNKGVPLERQEFDWRDLVRVPVSKLDDDAFTKVRIVLMNGIESDQNRFLHALARMNLDLRVPLARVRRVDHHQQTLVNWLLPPDMSPLETTIVFEQVAIEVTAHVAMHEPDPYLASMYRFGLLEDFDHMYRFSALMDRLEGKDSNNLLQSYTDVLPGRPTSVEHRHPDDDLRKPFDRNTALPISKLNAMTITAGENQTRDYYMTIGPQFADPLARQLYAEIASIEEQHVTQYESLSDPHETPLGQWMLRECNEVWNYWSCYQQENNARVKEIWERFLSYELGQLHAVIDLFSRVEKRDPMKLLPKELPDAIGYESHRKFVRETLKNEVDLRAVGQNLVPSAQEPKDGPSARYRARINQAGSPSETVAAGYRWTPGTEVTTRAAHLHPEA
jgi:hypothetical protein